MTAIAGIARPDKKQEVHQMLDIMKHRGPVGEEVLDIQEVTFGVNWTTSQTSAWDLLRQDHMAADYAGRSRFAQASPESAGFVLKRDPVGIAPLYFGRMADGTLCFASEAKALLGMVENIQELPPGCILERCEVKPYTQLKGKTTTSASPVDMAHQVHDLLLNAVQVCIHSDTMGSWLSGGLDSSAVAALARPHLKRLHTFSIGMAGSPDLEHARIVAEYIQSEHHERVVESEELLQVLPAVIGNLESFDALLVRSSVTNYLVSQMTVGLVDQVFSGEGADELFGGYTYLKSLPMDALPDELVNITRSLHNTALQRVDRSAAAFGMVAHVPFLDPDVIDFALQIPPEVKIRDGMEKWILREALKGILPDTVLFRPKAKFWEGAGVEDHLAFYANHTISDGEFLRERNLINGWRLNSKEELMYYRIFEKKFGRLDDLSWVGRTKGAPVQ